MTPVSPLTDAFAQAFFRHAWQNTALGATASWPAALQQFARFALENSQPIFAFWGAERTLLFNEAFSHILGSRHMAALGCRADAVFEPVWASIAPFVDAAFAGEARLGEDLPLLTWASDFREQRYYSFSSSPVQDADGALVGGMCICTDTTERVLLQQALEAQGASFRSLLEGTPSFVAMTEGPEHRFIFANAAYRAYVGGREVDGRTVADVLPEVVPQGFVRILDDVYATGEPFKRSAMRLSLSSDEPQRFMNVLYAPRRNSDGDIVGLFSEGHDVTEQVQAAEKVRQLQNELIHVSRLSAMGALATTLAHELNQPLAAIANYSTATETFLRRGRLDEAGAAARATTESAHRAAAVIRGLRRMTVPNSLDGQDWFDLGDALEEAATLSAAHPICRPRMELEAGIKIRGERVQIQQVMLNLIRNACEAAAARPEPWVSVRARAEGSMAVITVADNGEGVPFDPIDRVFESFVSTKPDGMGVGLSISRTIVEAHGGRIAARNTDQGAEFTLWVPIRLPESAGGDAAGESKAASPA